MERRTWFTPRQEQFLQLVAKIPYVSSRFYLTGGTALAAIYYNHRVSLDLDLFSPKELNIRKITEALFSIQNRLRYVKIRRQPQKGEGNYILGFPNKETIFLDFVYYPFKRLKPSTKWKNLEIDSLEDIATNKLNTILQRTLMRDYIDLYCIMHRQKLSLKKLRKNMIKKFDWPIDPNVLSRHFLRVAEHTDIPQMKIPFSREKMIKFYENLAKSLEPEIFK